jgi:hypothetical protein
MDNLKIQPPYSDNTYDWNKESLPGTFKGFVRRNNPRLVCKLPTALPVH